MTDEKTKVSAAILTPYLRRTSCGMPDKMRAEHKSEGWDVGVEADDLVVTPGYEVSLDKASFSEECIPVIKGAAVTISGSSGSYEKLVDMLKGTGTIVVRYSMFHGGPSAYTGRMPGEGGFAIDMPKSPEAVYALLGHEGFLEGIVERDETKILDALDDLCETSGHEIRATPYLREALKA